MVAPVAWLQIGFKHYDTEAVVCSIFGFPSVHLHLQLRISDYRRIARALSQYKAKFDVFCAKCWIADASAQYSLGVDWAVLFSKKHECRRVASFYDKVLLQEVVHVTPAEIRSD